MIALTLAEIARIVGGRLAGGADPDAVVDGPVAYDSRRMGPGGLFLAFAGEHVDGHSYVGAAHDAGAVAALVTRPVAVASVEVPDVLTAVGALAAEVLRRLPDVTVVGLTGSAGKSSTKDLIGGLLARLGPTVAPPGSPNNELGLPVTVLQADETTRFLVLEMGARGTGHIAYLCRIAPPRLAAVLNVGSAHLGEFGSREAIAQAKGELVEALPPDGIAVLNADDPLVRAMAARTRARVVGFGEGASADVRAEDVTLDDLERARFTLRGEPVALQLVGAHQVGNALAAAAIALECGLPAAEVAAGLSEARPVSRWRMEITERPDGVTIINDAYNANPESMRAALKTLAALARSTRQRGTGRPGRSWAVLGPMAELGAETNAEHDALGRLAVRLDIARLVAVGADARLIAAGAALEGSWNGESSWVPDVDAAIALLRAELRPGDVVLVKASRSAALERVALALDEPSEPPDAPADGRDGG